MPCTHGVHVTQLCMHAHHANIASSRASCAPRHRGVHVRVIQCQAGSSSGKKKKNSSSSSSSSGGFGAVRAPTTEKKTCPCGSRKLFSQCCEPFHKGALPPTAEALMRSRYSAYANKNVDYIVETTHTGLNELYLKDGGVSLRKDAAATAEKINWEKLMVMEKEDVSETEAFVTFQVFFKVRKQQGSRAQG